MVKGIEANFSIEIDGLETRMIGGSLDPFKWTVNVRYVLWKDERSVLLVIFNVRKTLGF